MRWRGWLMAGLGGTLALAAVVVSALCLGSGCSSVGYLAQAGAGHLAMAGSGRPVPEVVADAATPAALRERLLLSQRMRDWAVSTLHLPDNRSYRSYADLGRPAAVWNVVAAPELSLALRAWCFPVVGCVGYRGYYSLDAANAAADELRQEPGLEVSVYPVPAYSTLGRTDWLGGDPLLNTFITWPEGELARMIFHELSHQVVYVPGDTMFNESYATAVERLGGDRWLHEQADAAAREQVAVLQARREAVRVLVNGARDELAAVYASGRSEAQKREAKADVLARLQAGYATLKREQWQGFNGYDAYFARMNNATLGVQAAYQQWVPAFEALWRREGCDFARFHRAVQTLAMLPKPDRDAALTALLSSAPAAP
ncbi:MAG: aminopeptidase [Burkholderiales bacterium PBB6]|nr:MAG: aminopeptidase [Burkholderiales bacterium PBB6]